MPFVISMKFLLASLAFCLFRASSAESPKSFCSLDCSGIRRRPVCGSDGRTYPSRCELDRARCRKKNLKVGHRGECLTGKDRCGQERATAQENNSQSGIDIFVPECTPSGAYVSVQCHYGTGYCWCVNETGKPVPGSSVRYKKPKCNKKVPRKRTRRGKKGTRKRHAKRICSQSDRMQFNNYVIERITAEFQESGQVLESSVSSSLHSRKNNPKKEMVDWKFRELDVDSNGILKRKEFGEFRKAVKRNSRNKQCANTFWKHCDLNDDKKMTPSEWTTCLGVDVNVSFRLFLSLNAKGDPLTESQNGLRTSEKPRISEPPRHESINDETSRHLDSPSGAKSCSQARLRTPSLDSEGSGGFIPECTSNGKYKGVQCFKSTGYCWCADEETGVPIPGTSTQNALPDCSRSAKESPKEDSPPTISSSRPWKKCPQASKEEFQRNVLKIFEILYSRHHQAEGVLEDQKGKILRWQFSVMDRNRDGRLSKKELRPLRTKIKKDQRLRRCGKRLPIHCDIDRNSFISLSEWEICFGLKEEESNVSSPGSILGKRRGVNPLKKYLRSD